MTREMKYPLRDALISRGRTDSPAVASIFNESIQWRLNIMKCDNCTFEKKNLHIGAHYTVCVECFNRIWHNYKSNPKRTWCGMDQDEFIEEFGATERHGVEFFLPRFLGAPEKALEDNLSFASGPETAPTPKQTCSTCELYTEQDPLWGSCNVKGNVAGTIENMPCHIPVAIIAAAQVKVCRKTDKEEPPNTCLTCKSYGEETLTETGNIALCSKKGVNVPGISGNMPCYRPRPAEKMVFLSLPEKTSQFERYFKEADKVREQLWSPSLVADRVYARELGFKYCKETETVLIDRCNALLVEKHSEKLAAAQEECTILADRLSIGGKQYDVAMEEFHNLNDLYHDLNETLNKILQETESLTDRLEDINHENKNLHDVIFQRAERLTPPNQTFVFALGVVTR